MKWTAPADLRAQVRRLWDRGLLLASLAAEGETVLREPGPSRDHTERMFAGWGLQVQSSQLQSEERKGTTFKLRLPMCVANDPA